MNFVRRLKHVVLPAPLGPISAWIVPRVTFRLTPLTATKPANSLVRFSVWRMKSSLTTLWSRWSTIVLPRPEQVEQKQGAACARSHARCAARSKAALAFWLDGLSTRSNARGAARDQLRSRLPAHPCHPSSTFPPFLCNGTVTAAIADSAWRNRRRRQQWEHWPCASS